MSGMMWKKQVKWRKKTIKFKMLLRRLLIKPKTSLRMEKKPVKQMRSLTNIKH
jgi:hypothetical protein